MSLVLAPIIVDRLLPVISTIARQHEMSILLVDQSVHAALQIADRAYVIRQGAIVLHETASALKAKPELLAAAYLAQEHPAADDAGSRE